jgi:hypothetical protein
MDKVQTVPAMRKKTGEVHTAHGTGFLRRWTENLIKLKIRAPKMPEPMGAMRRPAKMAPM